MVKCLLVGVGGGNSSIFDRFNTGGSTKQLSDKDIIDKCNRSICHWLNFCVSRKVSGITTSGFDIKDGSVWWIYDVLYICVGNRSINTERELRICDTLYRIKCDIKCCCGICCTNTYEVTMKIYGNRGLTIWIRESNI